MTVHDSGIQVVACAVCSSSVRFSEAGGHSTGCAPLMMLAVASANTAAARCLPKLTHSVASRSLTKVLTFSGQCIPAEQYDQPFYAGVATIIRPPRSPVLDMPVTRRVQAVSTRRAARKGECMASWPTWLIPIL